jgi:hypothetical protein
MRMGLSDVSASDHMRNLGLRYYIGLKHERVSQCIRDESRNVD